MVWMRSTARDARTPSAAPTPAAITHSSSDSAMIILSMRLPLQPPARRMPTSRGQGPVPAAVLVERAGVVDPHHPEAPPVDLDRVSHINAQIAGGAVAQHDRVRLRRAEDRACLPRRWVGGP